MARRDTDSGIQLESDSGSIRSMITIKSNSFEKIEVEINRDKSFVCYPYQESTIEETEINKIQEFLDKGLLVKAGG